MNHWIHQMYCMMDFPQELVVDILSTLPAKSLCRFKCVSKSFDTSISDSQFIKTHLTRRKEHSAILFCGSQFFFSTEFDESFDKKVTLKKLDFLSSTWEIVLGSCNGLVLLLIHRSRLHYWTHQHGFIWNCYFLLLGYVIHVWIGLGFIHQ